MTPKKPNNRSAYKEIIKALHTGKTVVLPEKINLHSLRSAWRREYSMLKEQGILQDNKVLEFSTSGEKQLAKVRTVEPITPEELI